MAMTNEKHTAVDFCDTDFSGETITNCNFAGCDFAGVQFNGTTITNSTFAGCDLATSDFPNATITNCTFAGCDLAVTTYNGATVSNVVFDGCDLSNSDFGGSTATNIHFNNCDLSDLSGLVFDNPTPEQSPEDLSNYEEQASELTPGPVFTFLGEQSFDPVVRIVNENGIAAVTGMGFRFQVTSETGSSWCRDGNKFIFVELTLWFEVRVTIGFIDTNGGCTALSEWNVDPGMQAEVTADSFTSD